MMQALARASAVAFIAGPLGKVLSMGGHAQLLVSLHMTVACSQESGACRG